MANVKVEVDFDDAIKQQCAELRELCTVARSNFDEVARWCYELLDCYDYSDMTKLLVAVIDKINSANDSFKEEFIEDIAAEKIAEMQNEIDRLNAKIDLLKMQNDEYVTKHTRMI